MDTVNNVPKPVVIGVVVVLVLIAGFVIFRTTNNMVNNNGYGSKEDIIARQKAGSGGPTGGHSATAHDNASQQGYGRGGYPSGYGQQGGR